MSFDGIPRPSQINPYNDPLGAYSAAYAAKAEQAGKPRIQSPGKDEGLKGLQKEEHQQADLDEDEQGQAFSEDEAEAILLLAKMRGVMNFALDPDVHYEFHLNPKSGMVELREASTGKRMLQLTPEELIHLSEKLHRAAGMLSDLSG